MRTLTRHNQGINIAYQRFDSTDDPLLLIMDIGADMLYWHDDFCAALVNRGFEVVRFDNRDSGESTQLLLRDCRTDFHTSDDKCVRTLPPWSYAANEC